MFTFVVLKRDVVVTDKMDVGTKYACFSAEPVDQYNKFRKDEKKKKKMPETRKEESIKREQSLCWEKQKGKNHS